MRTDANIARMKLTSWMTIALLNLILAAPVRAGRPTDDSDLSGNSARLHSDSTLAPSLDLKPDASDRSQIDTGAELRVELLRRDGAALPVAGLTLHAGDLEITTDSTGTARISECAPRATYRLQTELTHSRIRVTDGSSPYRFRTSIDCGTRTVLQFTEAGDSGQALAIWRIAHLGLTKLESAIGLNFWNKPIEFIWPEDGDYYSFGTVHISRGDHWDVVGHEMGHAIYDLGRLGAFGGGSHKIDECYSEALALSEGWASYFSAWLSVAIDDADAQFEYMVPRRAPLRFENVPLDVCNGPTNEWRVTSFLWDLIDRSDDGEKSEESFAMLWRALQGTRTSGIRSAAGLIERAGFSKEWLSLIWDLNFRTPRAPTIP